MSSNQNDDFWVWIIIRIFVGMIGYNLIMAGKSYLRDKHNKQVELEVRQMQDSYYDLAEQRLKIYYDHSKEIIKTQKKINKDVAEIMRGFRQSSEQQKQISQELVTCKHELEKTVKDIPGSAS